MKTVAVILRNENGKNTKDRKRCARGYRSIWEEGDAVQGKDSETDYHMKDHNAYCKANRKQHSGLMQNL